jgi:hypothetical protein
MRRCRAWANPTPFSFPDLAVVRYRKENTNSLKFFLSKICKPATDNDSSTQSIFMIDLKEKYEAYSFRSKDSP